MPAPMPGHVAKGDIISKLEKVLNSNERAAFYARISAQAGGGWKEDLLDVAEDMLPLDPGERTHLQTHWFDHHGSWWPRAQPLDDLVRVGLIRAIEIADGKVPQAGNQKLDIDCYWICTGGSGASLTSCVSEQQVTLLIFTPPPPISDNLPGPYSGAERIFTAQHRSAGPGFTEIGNPLAFVELLQTHKP